MKKVWLDSMRFLRRMLGQKSSPSMSQEGNSLAANQVNTKNAGQSLGVNTLLWILTGIMALSVVGIGGFGYYSNYSGLQVAERNLNESEVNLKMVVLSQGAEVKFKKQIQEWKNILLRGGDQELFKKYLSAFGSQEKEVQEDLNTLKSIMVKHSELTSTDIARVDAILKSHMELGVKYREALDRYDHASPALSANTVDSMVKGVDRVPTDVMEGLVLRINDLSIKKINDAKKELDNTFEFITKIFILVVIIALILTFMFTFSIRKGVNNILEKVKNLLADSEQQNRRNQDSILRLLDEVADLADGDLTRKPVVTEDITGAIADSLGYAIETLRNLVGAINSTAEKVASGAAATKESALKLTAEGDRQAHEINTAGIAVAGMTKSIGQVSQNAVESSSVAKQSVDIAKRGAQTVQYTIQSMETIREQIQETSKRIKRLGESSKEIGEIVALINDIADQTSILALNASIQAAMAGEAGRGFSVVADEVQRLSERVGNSTKQIESLVKAIQADTGEAVISMEKSTAGVISGARLAQDAGKALAEIETVSVNLDKLIENISREANEQSSTAGAVSDLMGMIQDISAKTSLGTKNAAISIGELTGLAGELKKSVAGFKLPG